MEYTLTLTPNEAQAIVDILAQMPTQTGAFPLYQKVVAQLQAQMPEQEPTETSAQ